MFSNLFLNSIHSIPSHVYASVICCRLNIINLEPLKYIVCHTVNSNFNIMTCIIKLFNIICPSAILWSIISIVINAVDGRSLEWPISHVCIEILKRFPSLTNCNSASAIIFKHLSMRISTPCSHPQPSSILWSFTHSMLCHCLHGDLFIQTSTTFDMSIVKMLDKNGVHIPAIAFTNPIISAMRTV